MLRKHDSTCEGACACEYPRQQLAVATDAADAVTKAEATASLPPSPPSLPPPPRLDAHCDSTLLTLLWVDSPGLQVLDAPRAEALGWRPEHVLGLGLPTMVMMAKVGPVGIPILGPTLASSVCPCA